MVKGIDAFYGFLLTLLGREYRGRWPWLSEANKCGHAHAELVSLWNEPRQVHKIFMLIFALLLSVLATPSAFGQYSAPSDSSPLVVAIATESVQAPAKAE